jgi:hypothetical protein
MQAVVRSYQTMGVALVGASVVAVSPMAPPMPHVQAVERAVSSAGVKLDALVNPIEQWVQVLQAAGANLGAIGQEIVDNPTPILDQVIANQTANAQAFGASVQLNGGDIVHDMQTLQESLPTLAAQLQAGNFTGALNTFNDSGFTPAILSALTIVSDSLNPLVNTVQNFAKAMATIPEGGNSPSLFLSAVLPLTYPLVSAMYAAAQTGDDVAAGVAAGNVNAVVNALVNAPANLVGGVLNGTGNILGFLPGAGVLTPFDPVFGSLDSGPIASLNELREVIAEALGKPVPVAATTSDAVTPAAAVSAIASVPTASKLVTLAATPSTSASTSTALVARRVRLSIDSAEASVSGTPATVSGTPAGSVVKRTHDSTKSGTAQKHDGHSAKTDKSGRSGKSAKSGKSGK